MVLTSHKGLNSKLYYIPTIIILPPIKFATTKYPMGQSGKLSNYRDEPILHNNLKISSDKFRLMIIHMLYLHFLYQKIYKF